MSQLPVSENRGVAGNKPNAGHAFWLSGIGGFVLGVMTVIIVLLLTRKAGDRDEPGAAAWPQQQAVQHDAPTDAKTLR